MVLFKVADKNFVYSSFEKIEFFITETKLFTDAPVARPSTFSGVLMVLPSMESIHAQSKK